ncbi:MAG: DUF2256 and DUF3253 domain-containing protein [Pseudomonadota bacterium]
MTDAAEKLCARCGRRMQWRKKWARNWDSVKYCSDACRRQRLTTVDAELESTILSLLKQRATGATICPSEAARQVAASDWRALMEPARQAARRLVAQRRIDITQQGHVVDASTARGPIRLRLRDG